MTCYKIHTLGADLIRSVLFLIILNWIDNDKWTAKVLDKYEVVTKYKKKTFFWWMYLTPFPWLLWLAIYSYGKDFFVIINEITLLHTIVLLLVLCFYLNIFLKKYWHWILILQYFKSILNTEYFTFILYLSKLWLKYLDMCLTVEINRIRYHIIHYFNFKNDKMSNNNNNLFSNPGLGMYKNLICLPHMTKVPK